MEWLITSIPAKEYRFLSSLVEIDMIIFFQLLEEKGSMRQVV